MVNINNGDSMNKIVKRLETEFSKSPDFVIKEINLSIFKTMYLIYLETVSSSDKENDYILKNIILKMYHLLQQKHYILCII